MHLDEFDQKILERLQRDATIAVADLADQVGLSQSTCWRRINLLEQAGVIRARVALLDARALGLEVTVFANIKLSAHGRRALNEFEEAIALCPEVVECYTMSGEMDFLLRIVARDIEGYERFLRATLLQMPSVQEVHSHIALSQVKHTTILPLAAIRSLGGAVIALITVCGGVLSWPGGRVRAALGRNGLSTAKREGDGATPVGIFAPRRLLYRADRLARPKTALPIAAIQPADGWSDDPADPLYNRPVPLPRGYGHERLWRDDGLYDLVVPLGYNDDPAVPGLGSAIFLHCAWPDYRPTAGCVAVARDDLLTILADCDPQTRIAITRSLKSDPRLFNAPDNRHSTKLVVFGKRGDDR